MSTHERVQHTNGGMGTRVTGMRGMRATGRALVLGVMGAATAVGWGQEGGGVADGAMKVPVLEVGGGTGGEAGRSGTGGRVLPLPEGDLAGWFEERVAELDAADFATRDAAQAAITSMPVTSRMIEERLTGADLSPEQRERLGALGLAKFAREPRGAMGVSFDRGPSNIEGVTIGATIEGFDAARTLRAGDVIQSLDGTPVRTVAEARTAIISRAPGDVVDVSIVRGGEAQVVRVRLGNLSELQQGPEMTTALARSVWEYRRRHVAPKGPAPAASLRTAISPVRWDAFATEIRDRIIDRINRQRASESGPEAWTTMVAGGDARQPTIDATYAFSLQGDQGSGTTMRMIQDRMERAITQIRFNEARLANPNLRPADRQNIEAQNEMLRQQIRVLRAQMDQQIQQPRR